MQINGVQCWMPQPPYWTGDPPPLKSPTAAVPRLTIEEQLGVDPISKLAAAIEKLADALKELE